MGKSIYCELRGWGENGRYLSVSEKEAIQDWIFDVDVEDYTTCHTPKTAEIMLFGTTRFNAWMDICKALESYSRLNPNLILEIEYTCDEDGVHDIIRYKNGACEALSAEKNIPEFKHIVIPDKIFAIVSLDGREIIGVFESMEKASAWMEDNRLTDKAEIDEAPFYK